MDGMPIKVILPQMFSNPENWFRPFKRTPRGTIKTPSGPYQTSAKLVREYLEWRYAVEWETENDIYYYKRTETGIGQCLIISHPASGEEFDATDYESW